MNKFLIGTFFVCVLVSCKSEPTVEFSDVIEVVDQDLIISSIGVQLSEVAKKEMDTWGEYQMITEIIERYTSISKSQALDDAKSLSDLVKTFKESEIITLLDRPDVHIRINVLFNHSLRLNDMALIPSISDQEVEDEITKMLEAYSSLNDKINAVVEISGYENKYKINTVKKESTSTDSDRNDIRLKAMKEYESSSKTN